jgi:Tfp pilus assembly protein PilV
MPPALRGGRHMGKQASKRQRRSDGGFTLLEVLIAVLLAMIGLLGTVAVQMTVLSGSQNSNDVGIAMRLATQAMEELNARLVRLPTEDQLRAVATPPPGPCVWSAPLYLNANGAASAVATPVFRWTRRTCVLDRGVGLPYDISVEVSFALDTGAPKIVRVDMERRKSW